MKNCSRRRFLAITGSAAAALTARSAFAAPASPGRRFNILWLMADQHTYSRLGCAGDPVVKTPHLDALAAEGVRFTHATCVTPFCSPTRASWVTGLYPHAHGMVGNVNGNNPWLTDSTQRPNGEPLACTENILFDAGWAAAQFGKWHLGRQGDLRCYAGADSFGESKNRYKKEKLDPLGNEAFDEGPRPNEVEKGEYFMIRSLAALGQAAVEDEEGGGGADRLRPAQRRAIGGPRKDTIPVCGREKVKAEHSYENWLADQCIAFMEENRDRNFMATLSMSPPHAPWICSTKYYDMYDPAEIPLPASFDHKPEDYRGSGAARWGDLLDEECKREYLRCYYGQVSMIDDVFGRVLEALDRLGLKDDTLVIYTSDHGDLQTAHSLLGKSAYGFFDEIVRVPLIMRYPKAFPAGEVREHFAGSVDLAPTILSLAGQPVPEGLHGRDLRPAIEGRQADDFDAGFCERGAGTTERFGRMIRTAKAKYCVYGDGRVELFDYETDPHEMRNVANEADYRELRATLHERLRQQAAATGDPALERIPPL